MKTQSILKDLNPIKTFFARMLMVVFIIVVTSAVSKAATYTWNNAGGGLWTTAANWTPNIAGGPPAGSDIIINIAVGGTGITAMPTIALNSLTVTGNCLIGAAASGNTLTITSALSIAAGNTLTLGAAAERVVFTLNAAATATVNGNLAFDAGTTIRNFTVNGTLIVNPTGRVYDPAISAGSVFILNSGATLKIGNTGGITTAVTADPTVAINFGGSLTYNSGANYFYIGNAAQVTGSGLSQNTPANVTIDNPGNTVTLSANTNMSGALTVTAGSTFALSTFTLGATTAPTSVALYDGATTGSSITGTGALSLGGNVTVINSGTGNNGATVAPPIVLTAARLFTVADDGTAANDLTLSGILSGAFAITKAGAGTMLLSGANTYTGLTTISAGTLKLGNAAALGTVASGTTITSGAVLDLNGINYAALEPLTINGTGIAAGGAVTNSSAAAATYAGLITLGSTSSIITDAGDINISNAGTITGATFGLTIGGSGNGTVTSIIGTTTGTVDKIGTGVWTVSGANTYTGATTVDAGVLKLGSASALGTIASGTTVLSGAALCLNGQNYINAETLTLNGTGIGGNGALINCSATGATFAGNIILGSPSSIVAGTGTIHLSSTSSVVGGTNALTFGGAAGGTFDGNLNTGTGTLTKVDAGTWILTGNNSYSGVTTITAGDLRLNPAIGVITPASQFLLNGGTLSTTGITLNRTITSSSTLNLALSSTINLGANAHTLTFADSHLIGWTAGQMITINGWTGGYNGTTGTAGQIFFGASNTTLTAAQLAEIRFFSGTSYYKAMLLATGELVPTGNTITTGTISGSPFCLGESGIAVPFTYLTPGGFPGAIFTAQLSNAAGSFIAPTALQTVVSDGSGSQSISVTIPGATPTGNGYRIRVVSNVPVVTGTDNGVNLTVNPTVGTPTAITVSAGIEPTCQLTNGTTTTTYATTATNSTGFNWSLSNGAAGSIGATTGIMTWANGFSGTVNIQVTANGCNGPSAQVIRTVNITPTVGTPTAITVSAGIEPTCQLTNGTTTTTYSTTATNNTGFNWSLSNGAAGSIGATTGVMTWANGFSGTVNIQVTANGCNGPSAQVIRTVNITPTVGTPTAITVSAGIEPTCQLTNGTTTTTYATTATNNTGFNWSLSNGAAGSIGATTGVMTWANGFSGTVNIQVTANGCNGPSAQVIRTVNITPTVGTPTAITVSAGIEPTCQLTNGTTTTTYATTATNNTGFNWSLSNGAAGSIGATTGIMTWANGFSGTVNIQVTANGCNGPSAQVIRTVNITPTVGTPTAITVSAGIEPTCQLTNGTTTTTYSTTATNNTGFNWSLSNGAAGSIGATTGVMTWANGFSGTVNIQVTANGCNGPSAQVIRTVNITPTVGTPTAITVSAGIEPTCQLTNGTTTTTYATTATNNTGFNWSLSNGAAGSIGATTGVMTWANGFSGTVNIQVTANGCNGPSAQVIRTVNITPTVGTPTAITVSAGIEPTCQLTNGTTTTTYATTATNNTGFNWSLSNGAAGSIGATTGIMTWANGFSGTVNIQVTANGCNGPSAQVIRTVNITPTVGTPTAITVSAGIEPTCQLTNGTTTTTYATTATNNTGFNWSLSNGAAGSIGATTGIMTWANGFSGTVNIQVTANGCNGPSAQVIRTVNITPTVGTPTAITVSAGIEPTCQLTNGTTTTTYATTATNNTGFNWSLSNGAAGSIGHSECCSNLCNGHNPALYRGHRKLYCQRRRPWRRCRRMEQQ
jgi:autotransporter-associated beta strand protein